MAPHPRIITVHAYTEEKVPNEDQNDKEGMSRARFLALLTAAIGGFISFVMGGLGLGYFLSPAWKKKKENWVEMGPVGSLKEGKPVKVDFVSRKVDGWMTEEGRSSAWVVKQGKDITVFSPSCTHLGCAYRWDDKKEEFQCPCHTAVFDVTGAVVTGPPPRPLDRFPVKVEAGSLYILPKEVQS